MRTAIFLNVFIFTVIVILVSFVIVFIDSYERRKAKQFIKEMWFYWPCGVISLLLWRWVANTDFRTGIDAILWLLSNVTALVCAAFFIFGVIFVGPEIIDLVRTALSVLWRWREYPIRFVQFVVDLFIHPPSVKEIRETLRSTLPEEEKIRKVSTALREEYEAVMGTEMAGWKRASFGRQHKAFADEISARRAKAMAAYHRGIAETARTIREAAEEKAKMSAEGERDEQR